MREAVCFGSRLLKSFPSNAAGQIHTREICAACNIDLFSRGVEGMQSRKNIRTARDCLLRSFGQGRGCLRLLCSNKRGKHNGYR